MMHKRIYTIVYNTAIAILALTSIVMAVLDICGRIDLMSQPFRAIDIGILLIFAVDYIIRFCRAEDRKRFFLENIFDLLAIIPFSSLFSVFRAVRLVRAARFLKLARFVRGGAVLGILWRRAGGILRTNGFAYVLCANAVLVLGASVIMMHAEGMTFADALWWSIVTCATVGYGDISPQTAVGRCVAVVLMLFGIGLLGMLTGAITTYFAQPRKAKVQPDSDDELQQLLDSATAEERKKILEIAKIIIK